MSEAPINTPRRIWPWVLAGLGVFVLLFVAIICFTVTSLFNSSSSDDSTFGSSTNSVAVVDIKGVILTSDSTITALRKFADDKSVKAIVLHINSPGGGAAASQEIYNEVRRIRDVDKKPIVATIDSVGASGAYYIASGTNKIYANDASIVGSIGVIIEYVNYGDLLKWARMKQVVIKSGELKDTGIPTRDMTPKETAYMQGLVNNMFEQFLHDVCDGRKIPVDTLRPLANGQVWTGQQALPLHLIDTIGGYHDALLDAAKLGGIKGEPHILRPAKPKSLLASLLSSDSDSDSDLFHAPGQLIGQYPGFYFLWQ